MLHLVQNQICGKCFPCLKIKHRDNKEEPFKRDQSSRRNVLKMDINWIHWLRMHSATQKKLHSRIKCLLIKIMPFLKPMLQSYDIRQSIWLITMTINRISLQFFVDTSKYIFRHSNFLFQTLF